MASPISATKGRPRKPAGEAQRDYNVIELPAKGDLPRAPGLPDSGEYLKSTRDKWARLWAGPLAHILDPSMDVPALARLFGLYDEHERARRALKGKPRSGGKRVVEGSAGQPVLSPLAKYMRGLEPEIIRLEDRFGLSPAARLRMSVDASSRTRSRTLDDINRGFADGDEDEDETHDPRAIPTTSTETG